MVEAGKQFRRVNGHLHLCSLRDTLLKRVALVSPTVDPRVRTAPRLFPAGWRRASRACAAVTPGNRARTVADHPPGRGFRGPHFLWAVRRVSARPGGPSLDTGDPGTGQGPRGGDVGWWAPGGGVRSGGSVTTPSRADRGRPAATRARRTPDAVDTAPR